MFTIRPAVVLAAAAWACPALADELHVPSQYPTIAAAVAASQAGDEIILADGEYTGDGNHDIAMPGHALTLRSASGNPEACVIQMRGPWVARERAFRFTAASSSEISIRDMTMRNGGGGDGPGFFTSIGGAVSIEGSSPTFENCVFDNNWASGDCVTTYGGAVYLADSVATFVRCVFVSNIATSGPCGGATSGEGGGVYVAGGSPSFIECRFDSNEAESGSGGGMYVAGGSVLLLRTHFVENEAWAFDRVTYGGALATAGHVTAIECDFTRNTAFGSRPGGGAVAILRGQLDLVNCRFIANSASSDGWTPLGAFGGGIYAEGGLVSLTNCLLSDNRVWQEDGKCHPPTSVGAFGGAICVSGNTTVTMRSSTLLGDTADVCLGAAAFLTDDLARGTQTLDIANSIIWDSGAEPIATSGAGATVEVNFSILKGEWPGEQILDVDPMFANHAQGDYRLSPGSPAADAGANDLVPPDTFDLDDDGDTTEPLPLDLAFAPRFTDDPAATDTGRGSAPIIDMGAYETAVGGCYADCDEGGELDFFDFLCFQNAFAARESYADCDGSGDFDFFDFLCFQNAFAAGCP